MTPGQYDYLLSLSPRCMRSRSWYWPDRRALKTMTAAGWVEPAPGRCHHWAVRITPAGEAALDAIQIIDGDDND